MKLFIPILAVLLVLGIIFFQYYKNKELKKLLISLATLIALFSLAFMGKITMQVKPIWFVHIVLVIIAWMGLIVYLVRDKYYWWVIFSPVLTIGIFLLLEFFTGSGHDIG